MKKIRKILSGILSAVMLFAAAAPASAAVSDIGFTDVDAGVWYADAVQYARENGLMSGTGNNAFAPNDTTNLAMLLSTLHRDAGTPAASGTAPAGVPTGSWYANAVIWADAQNLLQNVNNDFAGAPLTREDMVTVLWRYAGSPAVTGGEAFADNALISSYAAQAVAWSRANNIVAGKPDNRFDPKGGATRAEYAVILQNFMKVKGTPAVPQPDAQGKALVVYFSMPETTSAENMTREEDNSVVVINGQVLGNTQYMASVIQETTGADLFRIEPKTPYPTDHSALVALASEEQDANARPEIAARIADFDQYDTVYVGYPIWWSDMPMILYTFFDTYDFTGKTIVPFSTHGGSGFAGTPARIAQLEPGATLLDGLTISRDNIQDARQQIVDWVSGLK